MAGLMIVNTEHPANPMLPVIFAPDAFARLPAWWFRVLIIPTPRCVKGEEEEMKLYLFFILFDLLILLMYPILFVVSKIRKYKGFKG